MAQRAGRSAAHARHIPTLADVAREAGVNASTVSRVLSGRGQLRPDTRERVLRAVEQLNYRPSHSARTLASRRSMTVGVLLADMRNLVHGDFLQGVQQVLIPHGYSILICDGQVDPEVQEAELERLLEARVDALLVTRSFTLTGLLQPFEASGIPVEPIEVLKPARKRILDRRRVGSTQAFEHLVQMGHRRFGFFIRARQDAKRLSAEMRSRLQALEDVLVAAGLDPLTAITVAYVREPDDCIAHLNAMMTGDVPPTALIGGNDWTSAPLLRAVVERELDIPADVSVLCFGDSRWAEAYRPPLSVVRYDYHAEGVLLARRLLTRLGDEPSVDGQDRGLPPDEFVRRASLSPPLDPRGARRRKAKQSTGPPSKAARKAATLLD